MILKCFDGPMDGAVYALSRETSDPSNRSTNRKPDGLWFDGQDEHGRNVQHQYEFEMLEQMGDDVCQCYRYSGPVVDTGIDFETNPRGDVTSGNRPTLPDEIPDALKVPYSPELQSRELTPDEHTEERIKNATEGAVDAYDE